METVKKPQAKTAEKATAKTAEKAPKKEVNNLAEQIKYYNHMARLAHVRARFIQTRDELEAVELIEAASVTQFENSEKYKLILKHGYNNEVLSVANEFILSEFKAFMIAKINQKIEAIDRELIGI